MTTPKENIEAMEEFAKLVASHPYVESAHIDDWGNFSNFALIVTPKVWTKGSTNRLKAIVRQLLGTTSAQLRQCFPPEHTGTNYLGKRTYHCEFWKFDIDYEEYNPATNQFLSQI